MNWLDVFEVIVAILVSSAAVLNLAVMRDRYIEHNHSLHVEGRRLIFFGFFIMAIHFWWLLSDGKSLNIGGIPGVIAVSILSLGSCMNCMALIDVRWSAHYEGIDRRGGYDRRHSVNGAVPLEHRRGERRASNIH